MPPAAKLIKKITPSTVCGELNPSKDRIKEKRVLYDLFGIVVKTRSGHSQYGDWTRFVGQFEAITPDGEVFSAPGAHIPQPFEDMLFASLAQAQEKDAKASVRFACQISIVPPKPGKASAVGYEFEVVPLVESDETNPLADMKKQVSQDRKAALPAPGPGGGRGR